MFLKPMQIVKIIIIGCLLVWMFTYLMGFYGISGKATWPYTSYFLFILFSTAILDLQVPSVN